MNYHDVLGVRPNAGPEEIELAYKGRRSQYHPDRYSQADEETQAWATRKMQELNEAYRVLCERKPSQGTPSDEPRQDPPAPASVPPRLPLQHYLKSYSSRFAGDRIYLAPEIPSRKIAGALESYGQGLAAKDIVLLIDDTVFGGAKEGVLITEAGIRVKELGKSPLRIPFEQISTISSKNKRIYVDGVQLCTCQLADSYELDKLCRVLQQYLGSPVKEENNTPQQSKPKSQKEGEIAGMSPWLFGFFKNMEAELLRKHSRTEQEELAVSLISTAHKAMETIRRFNKSETPLQAAILSSDIAIAEVICLQMALLAETARQANANTMEVNMLGMQVFEIALLPFGMRLEEPHPGIGPPSANETEGFFKGVMARLEGYSIQFRGMRPFEDVGRVFAWNLELPNGLGAFFRVNRDVDWIAVFPEQLRSLLSYIGNENLVGIVMNEMDG